MGWERCDGWGKARVSFLPSHPSFSVGVRGWVGVRSVRECTVQYKRHTYVRTVHTYIHTSLPGWDEWMEGGMNAPHITSPRVSLSLFPPSSLETGGMGCVCMGDLSPSPSFPSSQSVSVYPIPRIPASYSHPIPSSPSLPLPLPRLSPKYITTPLPL